MFVRGSIWKPLSTNFYTQRVNCRGRGIPGRIAEEDLLEPNKAILLVAQHDPSEDIIRRLTSELNKIVDGMIRSFEVEDEEEDLDGVPLDALHCSSQSCCAAT